MNSFDWWSLALIPGLAALGWSFRNALRLKAIERELVRFKDGSAMVIRLPRAVPDERGGVRAC